MAPPMSNVVWEIHEDRIQRLEGDVKTIASDVSEVKAYQKTQFRQMEQLGERVGRMEGQLRDAVDELKDHIDTSVGKVSDDVKSVDKRVHALEFRREEKMEATKFWRNFAIGLLLTAAGSLIPAGYQLLLKVVGG